MDMGFDGVSLSKPGGPHSADDNSNTTDFGQMDSDVFDAVTENLPLTTPPMFNNSIKYI